MKKTKEPPLDAGTWGEAAAAVGLARALGTSTIEELHRAGLILSPAVKRKIQVEVLQEFHDLLQELGAARVLQQATGTAGQAATSDQTLAAVMHWLRQHITCKRSLP